MRAILIDPYARTVTELDHSGELQAMIETIGGGPSSIRVSSTDMLWVDDEGFLRPSIPIFRLGQAPDPIAGKGLVLGIDRAGANRPTTLPLDFVLDAVRWTSLETTGALKGPTQDKNPQGFDFVIRVGAPLLRKRE